MGMGRGPHPSRNFASRILVVRISFTSERKSVGLAQEYYHHDRVIQMVKDTVWHQLLR